MPLQSIPQRITRDLNRSVVLDLLRHRSPISRASISKASTLTKPTVSAIVDGLIRDGLVSEIGVARSGGGRPPVLLEFNARSQFTLGISIGVETTKFVVADAVGATLGRYDIATPSVRASELLGVVADKAIRSIGDAAASRKRLVAVGVAIPGPIDMKSGRCVQAPNLGWRNVPVRDILEGALQVPVFPINNARASVVAEAYEGGAQGSTDVALIYVGRGIGSGIMSDGNLLHGSTGIAGRLGHWHVPGANDPCNCGRTGCLETIAAGPALAKAASAAIAQGRPTILAESRGHVRPEALAPAAAQGDELATEILEKGGHYLGMAASWLINLLDPEVILLGGGMAAAGEALLAPMRRTAFALAPPEAAERVSIRLSALGGDADVRGAVLTAMRSLERMGQPVFGV